MFLQFSNTSRSMRAAWKSTAPIELISLLGALTTKIFVHFKEILNYPCRVNHIDKFTFAHILWLIKNFFFVIVFNQSTFYLMRLIALAINI